MAADHDVDRTDRRILAVLQSDGRITNQALAERVALSPSACLARVRRLERLGVIEHYQARLDPWALGPGLILFAEVWLERHRPSDLAAFEEAIKEIPEVLEGHLVSGAFDYLLKVIVADMPSWTALQERFAAMDLGVDKISTHVLIKKGKVFRGYPIQV
jgi:DNA-binding Lrp family transcriptional regulator